MEMLSDLIISLLETQPGTPEREKAYKMLEYVGVDRISANVIAAEFDKNWK